MWIVKRKFDNIVNRKIGLAYELESKYIKEAETGGH